MSTDTLRTALAELMKCEYIQRQEEYLAKGIGTETWLGKTIANARAALASPPAEPVAKLTCYGEGEAAVYELSGMHPAIASVPNGEHYLVIATPPTEPARAAEVLNEWVLMPRKPTKEMVLANSVCLNYELCKHSWDITKCDDCRRQGAERYQAALAATPTPAPQPRVLHSFSSIKAEELIQACVPGGNICDPQEVADNIRRYLDQWEPPAPQPAAPSEAAEFVNGSRLQAWITGGADIHPLTANLVVRFCRALASKLAAAEKKYGYSDGWRRNDWMDECRQHLMEHIAKGDPRDVAAYCAFLWHHGESTAAPSQPAAEAPSAAPSAAAVGPTDAQIIDAIHGSADSPVWMRLTPDQLVRTGRAVLALATAPNPQTAPSEALIDSLRGLDTSTRVRFYEHDFYVLSNFSAFRVHWRGHDFDTSEHAYHWAKFHGHPDAVNAAGFIDSQIERARSAHEAFKIAEGCKPRRRPDWDDVKVNIMLDILRAKAEQHEYVRRKLLATGDRELVEDSWRDDFWGWGPNRDGKNMLGRLWMQVRAELRATGRGE